MIHSAGSHRANALFLCCVFCGRVRGGQRPLEFTVCRCVAGFLFPFFVSSFVVVVSVTSVRPCDSFLLPPRQPPYIEGDASALSSVLAHTLPLVANVRFAKTKNKKLSLYSGRTCIGPSNPTPCCLRAFSASASHRQHVESRRPLLTRWLPVMARAPSNVVPSRSRRQCGPLPSFTLGVSIIITA